MLKKTVSIQIGSLSVSDPDLEIILGDLLRAGKQSEFIVAALFRYVQTAEGQSRFLRLMGINNRESDNSSAYNLSTAV